MYPAGNYSSFLRNIVVTHFSILHLCLIVTCNFTISFLYRYSLCLTALFQLLLIIYIYASLPSELRKSETSRLCAPSFLVQFYHILYLNLTSMLKNFKEAASPRFKLFENIPFLSIITKTAWKLPQIILQNWDFDPRARGNQSNSFLMCASLSLVNISMKIIP